MTNVGGLEVRALSLWQPWASLVALGAKRIETRSWSTPYRGTIAVHAAKRAEPGDIGPYNVERDNPRGTPPAYLLRGPIAHPYRLPLGEVVALAELVDVVPMVDAWPTVDDPRAAYVGPRYPWVVVGTRGHDGRPAIAPVDLEPERPFGDYRPGRYAWVLENVRPTRPVALRGRQGLWRLSDDEVAEVLAA